MYKQKKIAVISDISGFGKCSMTVALPIISAMKIQCCPLPTAILSNHTGYKDFFIDDYTDRMETYMSMWEKLDLEFNGICTGFLGSKQQIDIMIRFINRFKTQNTIVVVDPVMGDNGKLYSTYTKEMANEMKRLVAKADIALPNITEACALTETLYKRDGFQQKELMEICKKICDRGTKKVIITGIHQNEYIANFIYESENDYGFVRNKKINASFSGTGDIFSSVVISDIVNGAQLKDAVKKASRFISKSIKLSMDREINPVDGVCFEDFLNTLK